LLSVAPKDLGQRLWKLDLSDDDPQILVNSAIGDWKGFASTPHFAAFVLPEAFGQILEWVIAGLNDDDDEAESPRWMWTRFIADELGRDPSEASELDPVDMDLWIDMTVDEFCDRHRLLDRYDEAQEGGQG
jgi:hypothetical protein